MFIAMNRFRVTKGSEAAFEQVWLSRDSHLDQVPGFVEFHLLKGPEAEDHTLYASHTVWENRTVFEAWTKSEAFRAAHHRAGDNTLSRAPAIRGVRGPPDGGAGQGRGGVTTRYPILRRPHPDYRIAAAELHRDRSGGPRAAMPWRHRSLHPTSASRGRGVSTSAK